MAIGALTNISEQTPNLTPGPVVDNSNLVTVPVEQIQTFDPGLQSGQLQQLYGTGAMPAFQFARLVQTGERTFDPTNQFDKEAAEIIAATPDSELRSQGIDLSTKDLITEGLGFVGSSVISKAGQLASVAGADSFAKQIAPAIDSFLPSSMAMSSAGQAAAKSAAQAARYGLKAGETAVNRATAQSITNQLGSTASIGSTPDPNVFKVPTGQFNQASAGANLAAGSPSGALNSVASSPANTGIFGGDMFKGYTPSIPQIGTTFGIDLAIGLFSGKSPKQAIKDSAITTAGTAIGTYFGGPVGGFVGGTVAKVVSGGSVICTELHAQGEISDSEYRTTNFYNVTMLTKTHIKGYHYWGVPIAEKIKKGEAVKFWRWVYKQWFKHACYKLGKTKKFSIVGFAIAKSLETISLIAGKIYESTTEKRIFANG